MDILFKNKDCKGISNIDIKLLLMTNNSIIQYGERKQC